jgi:hypothetical protein
MRECVEDRGYMNIGSLLNGSASVSDAALVNEVAAKLLAREGADLPEFLREQIEIAEGNSDELSIRAWNDIRIAAEKLIAVGPLQNS